MKEIMVNFLKKMRQSTDKYTRKFTKRVPAVIGTQNFPVGSKD